MEHERLTAEFRDRMLTAVETVYRSANIIGTDSETIHQTAGGLRAGLAKDAADLLILKTILADSVATPDVPKALLTHNMKDSVTDETRPLLTAAGIDRFFVRAADALGWVSSL